MNTKEESPLAAEGKKTYLTDEDMRQVTGGGTQAPPQPGEGEETIGGELGWHPYYSGRQK